MSQMLHKSRGKSKAVQAASPVMNAVSLNVRGLTADFVRSVKVAAATEGTTIRQWIIAVIEDKLKRGTVR